jgi:hypothetical protein
MGGRYFNFDPVKPWAGGLGDVFSGIGEGLEYRDKRRTQDAQLEQERAKTKAYEAQIAATNKKLQLDEDRANIAFQQGQEDRRSKTVKDIADAAGGGRFGAAEAAAAGSQFFNPKTGRMEGVTFTRDAPGPAPEAPVAPEAPAMLPTQKPDAFVGPVEPPDVARARAMGEALGQRTQPPARGSADELLGDAAGANAAGMAERVQQERAQAAEAQRQNEVNKSTYDQQRAGYDVKNAAYQTERGKYDQALAHPKYTIGMPGGQSVHFDPQEAKLAKEEDARTTAALLRRQAGAQGIDPNIAAQMLRSADQIEAQIPAAAAGAINNTASATQAQGAKGALQDKQITSNEKIATGHDRAKVTAAGMSGGGGGSNPGSSSLVQMMEGAVDAEGNITDPHILSKIEAEAARRHIPPGGKNGYLNLIKEVTRGNAIAGRTGRANAALEATDAEGNRTGDYKSTTEARAGNKAEVSYSVVKKRLQEVMADYKANGARVTDPQKAQNRLSMITALQAALRPYNELGGTDASQKLEREIQGASGTPESLMNFALGLNPEIYDRILGEVEFRHTGAQKVRLRSGSGPGAAPNKAQAIAAGATGQRLPSPQEDNLAPKDRDLVKAARDEIAKKGPNAKSAKAYLDHLGVQ